MLNPEDRQMLPRVRRRLLDGMGDEPETPIAPPLPKPVMGDRGPVSGNTGIGGGVSREIEPPVTPMPSVSDAPSPDPLQPPPMRKPAPSMLEKKDGTRVPESQGAPDWVSMLMQADDDMGGQEAPAIPAPAPVLPERDGLAAAGLDDGAATDIASAYARTQQNMPAGVDSAKWLSGHVSPKYAWKEVASQHSLKTPAGRNAALAQLKAQYPQYFANASWEGDKLRIGGTPHPDFKGLTLIDVIKDEEGAALPRWGDPAQDAKNAQAVTSQAGKAQPGWGLAPGREPAQNSLIDQIRATLLELMGNGIER